ncbi:MAG: hypothetical protein Q8P60_15010 [Pseudorhodobacter sp.]|nr:hypothetical protein [Pseudorhodobacter sp.]
MLVRDACMQAFCAIEPKYLKQEADCQVVRDAFRVRICEIDIKKKNAVADAASNSIRQEDAS